MIEIMGKSYINEKEACSRYGYSQAWFQRRRHKKLPPPYIKIEGKGKILYPLPEIDLWFKKQMEIIN